MYFYKYQRAGNLEFSMLRNGEIFFASTSELNDASECRPRFILNGTEALWRRLSWFVLQEVCIRSGDFKQAGLDNIRSLLDLSLPIGKSLKTRVRNRDLGLEKLNALFCEILAEALDSTATTRQRQLILKSTSVFLAREFQAMLAEPAYIASFSKNAVNPTMWGHYADAERGFVLVYSTNDGTIGVGSPIKILHGTRPLGEDEDGDFEIGIYDNARLTLDAIRYCKKPPKVNAFHRIIPRFMYSEEEEHYDVPLLLSGDARRKEENLVGLTKYSDWRYEREIRAFLPFHHALPPDVRVIRVLPDGIRGLVFGPRMSSTDKERAILCCHLMRESLLRADGESHPIFAFFQATQAVDHFDLEISPVGILNGPYFGGRLPYVSINDLDESTVLLLNEMSREIKNGCDEVPVSSRG